MQKLVNTSIIWPLKNSVSSLIFKASSTFLETNNKKSSKLFRQFSTNTYFPIQELSSFKEDAPDGGVEDETHQQVMPAQPSTISFSKYTKFDNHYRKRFVESIKTKTQEMNEKLLVEWCCSEKVHGCNLSFIVDKLEDSKFGVEIANRTLVLSQSTVKFYPKTIEAFQDKFGSSSIQLFEKIQSLLPKWIESDKSGELNVEDHSTLKSIQIYGELFGGLFPNKKAIDSKAIQTGIHYCPHHDFYAFDVLMSFESGKQVWALFDNVDSLLDECGFQVRSQSLFRGTLEQCLDFDVKFNTRIPTTFYPEIVQERNASWKDLDNICEGVVIKPTNCNIFVGTERAVIKKKNEKFLDIGTTDRSPQDEANKKEKGDSDELTQVWNELSRYATSNRLQSVLSKIGELSKSNMFRVMKEFSNDALDEFKLDLERGALENCKPVSSLSSEDQKKIIKKVNDACMVLIKDQLSKPSE